VTKFGTIQLDIEDYLLILNRGHILTAILYLARLLFIS